MKKIIILCCFIIFLTGCSVANLNKNDFEDTINSLLTSPISNSNTPLKGYEFYLPRGMTRINDTSSNSVIYSNNDKYYLYVDLISYYNKEKNVYKINEEEYAFYSQEIDNDGKTGYVLVTKLDNKYFVEVMYNYGKIEVVTYNYKEAVAKSIIILKSINFNDKVIESIMGENALTYKTEEFKLLGPSTETIDFLKEYVEPDETKKTDDDIKITD